MSIELSDAQSLAISNAAQALCPQDRDQFFAAVARLLEGHEVGDGLVHRAVSTAFLSYWHPPSAEATRATTRWNRVEPRFEKSSRRAY